MIPAMQALPGPCLRSTRCRDGKSPNNAPFPTFFGVVTARKAAVHLQPKLRLHLRLAVDLVLSDTPPGASSCPSFSAHDLLRQPQSACAHRGSKVGTRRFEPMAYIRLSASEFVCIAS